jgi:HipA-like protein
MGIAFLPSCPAFYKAVALTTMAHFWPGDLAGNWRSELFSDLSWRPTAEERPGGESQGFFVTDSRLRAYLKPSKGEPAISQHPRAAHEKIAADLAFDLNLPVPPALLVDGTKCGGADRAAVVSLVMFPEVHKWSHATATPAAAAIAHHLLRSTNRTWSGMIAFDTWIANSDRNNPSNVLVGTDIDASPNSSRIIFCDFAHSMVHSQWADGSWQRVTGASFLDVLLQCYDRASAIDVAERIKVFPDEEIRNIVDRIPTDYLSPENKALIIKALCHRKEMVPSVVAEFK